MATNRIRMDPFQNTRWKSIWEEFLMTKKGNMVVQIGTNGEWDLTEEEFRHIYAQWWMGKGWMNPPLDMETYSQDKYTMRMEMELRWKGETADGIEGYWSVKGEEDITKLWFHKGQAKDKMIFTFQAYEEGLPAWNSPDVTMELQWTIPVDKKDGGYIKYVVGEDEVPENWVDPTGPKVELEWRRVYIMPIHVKPMVNVCLEEIRKGVGATFWVHDRQSAVFTQVPTYHYSFCVESDEMIVEEKKTKGKKSANVSGFQSDVFMDQMVKWITAGMLDIQGSLMLITPDMESKMRTVWEDVWKGMGSKTSDVIMPEWLSREAYHTTDGLLDYMGQEEIAGENGYLWVVPREGGADMMNEVIWWGEGGIMRRIGWKVQDMEGCVFMGILVSSQSKIYIRDTAFWKGSDVREEPFMLKKRVKTVSVTPKDRWGMVQMFLRDMGKKTSVWKAMSGITLEWQIALEPIKLFMNPLENWNNLSDEEKEKYPEPVAWFVGKWLEMIESSGERVATGPHGWSVSGRRRGIRFIHTGDSVSNESDTADKKKKKSETKGTHTEYIWYFPEEQRIITQVKWRKQGGKIIKGTIPTEIATVNKRDTTPPHAGYDIVQYAGIYVMGQRKGDWEMVEWKPVYPPVENVTGVPPGGLNTKGVFVVAVPLHRGVPTTYVISEPGSQSYSEPGEPILDDAYVEWQCVAYPGYSGGVAPWRPIRVVPRSRHMRVVTEDEAEKYWKAYRTPITEEDWKEGRVPRPVEVQIPLPEAPQEASEGMEVGPNVVTEGEMEEVGEHMVNPEDKYYLREQGGLREKMPFQFFHNQVVKRYLLRYVAPAWDYLRKAGLEGESLMAAKLPRPSPPPSGVLYDFASGAAGDFYKWSDSRFTQVVGLEFVKANIEEAYRRVEDMKGYRPQIDFVWADMRQLIWPTLSAGMDEVAKDQMKRLMTARYQADVVSCQFAIHYFFETELTLRSFLYNVSEGLKVGGMFIGTCLDGERVNALLKGVRGGAKVGTIEGNQGSEILWKIERQYKPAQWRATGNNLGLPIDVLVSTIGQTFREFLVYQSTLVKFAKEVGLEVVEIAGFDKLFEWVKVGVPHYEQIRLMSEAERTYSFLNMFFVFRKVSNAPDSVFSKIRKLGGVTDKVQKGGENSSEKEEEAEYRDIIVADSAFQGPRLREEDIEENPAQTIEKQEKDTQDDKEPIIAIVEKEDSEEQ